MLNSGVKRIYALVICFSFVCLWHGSDSAICISSVLNCLLVSSEVAVKHLSTSKIGIKFQVSIVFLLYFTKITSLRIKFFCLFLLFNYNLYFFCNSRNCLLQSVKELVLHMLLLTSYLCVFPVPSFCQTTI